MNSPRWSRRLLAWLAPQWRRDEVIGDLEEVHARYAGRHGRAGAWWRSSRDAGLVAAGLAGDRIRAVLAWATWSDLRLGFRQIRQTPVLSATSILALATGIALATAGFGLLDALLFSTLPYPNGDRFVRIEIADDSVASASTVIERFTDLATRAPALEHVGAMTGGEFNLTLPSGEIASIRTVLITPASLRHVPGLPLAGRPLIEADAQPGGEPAALLSEGLWRRRFDADPRVVGRTIDLSGERRTVVGVMPASFEFPSRPEIWLPLDDRFTGGTSAGPAAGVRLFGVLRAGASLEAANAQLGAIAAGALAPGQAAGSLRIAARGYTDDSGPGNTFFSGLVALLVLVLLVVASNIATLVAARGSARSMELAIRTALGAGRARIVGQLFVEVLLLGLIAAVAGAAAAHAFLGWLEAAIAEIPFWIHFAASPRTFLFVVIVTLGASAVAGVLPALAVTRGNLAGALQQSNRNVAGGFGYTAQALIVTEVALSVAMLIGAAAMARGFLGYVNGIPSIDESHILSARITAGPLDTGGDGRDLQARVVAAVRAVPGIVAAGAATHIPRRDPPLAAVEIEWPDRSTSRSAAPAVAAGPGFLETLGASAISGRLITADDARPGAAPVAVVNESFARSMLGGRSPLGLRLRSAEPRRNAPAEWREIVGVVPDLGLSTADRGASAGYYVPLTGGRSFRLAIRTAGHPIGAAAALRAALARLDPALQVREVLPLADVGWEERAFLSGTATAMVALGGVALLLSVVSIYALLSYAVTRRTKEIGVRLALGAPRTAVLSNVLRAAAVCLCAGAGLGVVLGAVLLEARELFAFRIPTGGAWTVPAVVFPMAAAGLVACWIPVRRALGIQPADALRE